LLDKELNAGLADSKVKARIVELGGTVLGGTPAEFGAIISEAVEKWARVIKFASIKVEWAGSSLDFPLIQLSRRIPVDRATVRALKRPHCRWRSGLVWRWLGEQWIFGGRGRVVQLSEPSQPFCY